MEDDQFNACFNMLIHHTVDRIINFIALSIAFTEAIYFLRKCIFTFLCSVWSTLRLRFREKGKLKNDISGICIAVWNWSEIKLFVTWKITECVKFFPTTYALTSYTIDSYRIHYNNICLIFEFLYALREHTAYWYNTDIVILSCPCFISFAFYRRVMLLCCFPR